jgi:hypothetical protein
MRGSRGLDNLGRPESSARPGKVIEESDVSAHQSGNKMYLHFVHEIRIAATTSYIIALAAPGRFSPGRLAITAHGFAQATAICRMLRQSRDCAAAGRSPQLSGAAAPAKRPSTKFRTCSVACVTMVSWVAAR